MSVLISRYTNRKDQRWCQLYWKARNRLAPNGSVWPLGSMKGKRRSYKVGRYYLARHQAGAKAHNTGAK